MKSRTRAVVALRETEKIKRQICLEGLHPCVLLNGELSRIVSRKTEWLKFLRDFSLAFKVLFVLYSRENYVSEWECINYNVVLCHWLFSQFDVKFKQKANILGNALRFKTVLLCSFGLILVEGTDTWRWICSMNFIWEQKHLGFQIYFSKNNFSVYYFFSCSFITVKFKVQPGEAENHLQNPVWSIHWLRPVNFSSMWRHDNLQNWDFG